MPNSIEALTQINLDDLVSSFGWQNQRLLAHLLRRTFVKPARTFASQMAEFDFTLGTSGLPNASRSTLKRYSRSLQVYGRELIPRGPFLALSNHPGMADTLSLFTALNRSDLKVIALGRPFLDALPNMSKQLFYLRDHSSSRIAFMRQVSAHLRNGGAPLTFPAGRIEPDPDVHTGALESLRSWTDSVGVFIRLAPETAVLPILVRGVVWKKAAFHPLLQLKRTHAEREKLAAALQLLAYTVWKVKPVTVRVQIGKPIYTKELGTTETQAIHQAVLAEMKQLIENPPEGLGEPAI